MAYCPKCGVEVERDTKNCPLCDFPLPDVDETQDSQGRKYPKAINTYREDHLEKKNKAIFSIGIIVLSLLVILGAVYLVYPWNHALIKYIAVADLSIFAVVFFSLGYLKPKYNFLGAYITVLVATWFIYLIGGSQSGWYFNYAIPIATLIYLDICIFMLVFKYTRHRSQFIYIPTNLILFTIVFAIGLDSIISFNMGGSVQLTWSLIVAISGICIIAVLLGVYHRIPEKTRKMLKKKMHV